MRNPEIMTFLAWLYLGIAVAVFALHNLLDWLNLRYAARHQSDIPGDIAARFPEGHLHRCLEYLQVQTLFGHFTGAFSLFLGFFWIFSGILPAMADQAARLTPGPVLAGLLVLAAYSLAGDLAELPFSWHETFKIEARFGFNRTTPAVFWGDFAKGLLLKAVLGIPCGAVVLWLVTRHPQGWWLPTAAFLVTFQVLVLFLYPRVIAPLFNKFTPLPDGELRQALRDMAERCGFPLANVFIMDGSRRSAHANAYFTGFGRHRRLVLYDTLVNQLSPAELTAVVAHEIGHYKHRHILKMILLMGGLITAGAWAACQLLGWPVFLGAFGLQAGQTGAALIVLGLAAGPFLAWFPPLLHLLQRRFEYQADDYAVRASGSHLPLREALLRLVETNLSNLTPHPLYSAAHYSHPTLLERLAALERADGKTDR